VEIDHGAFFNRTFPACFVRRDHRQLVQTASPLYGMMAPGMLKPSRKLPAAEQIHKV
jgi:hypothetical protein